MAGVDTIYAHAVHGLEPLCQTCRQQHWPRTRFFWHRYHRFFSPRWNDAFPCCACILSATRSSCKWSPALQIAAHGSRSTWRQRCNDSRTITHGRREERPRYELNVAHSLQWCCRDSNSAKTLLPRHCCQAKLTRYGNAPVTCFWDCSIPVYPPVPWARLQVPVVIAVVN